MKKIVYLSMLAGCLVSLGACNSSEYDLENQIPERYNKILYLQTTGKQELTLYDTGENNTFTYAVIKSGSEPTLTATADLKVLTQQELDERYGELEGVNYKVLSRDAYSLGNSHMEFASQDRYQNVTVSVDPTKVQADMEADPTAVWVLPLYATSEVDSINADKNNLFLQFTKILKPAVQFSNTRVSIITKQYGLVGTFTQEALFKLDVENISWDITCSFTVDAEYVNNYNTEHKTTYKLLDAHYSFAEQMVLSKGTTEAPLVVTIEGANLEPGDYMLPIKISNTSLFLPKEGEDVYPLTFCIMGTQLSRTGWTVVASSQTVEGNGNGAASNIFDDNINTYWHSKWDNGYPPLPHDLVIDTKTMHEFTQISLQRRLGYNYARSGYFYVSDTGESWQEVGTFTMENQDAVQTFSITPTKGRYVKVEVTESNNNNNCAAFSEVYLYGIN